MGLMAVVWFLILSTLGLSYGYQEGTYCYDDVCADTADEVASVWFSDRPEVFICPQPYSTCDVGKLAFQFCFDTLGYSGHNRSLCANSLWRMHAIKEQLIVRLQLNESQPVNKLGFTRTNAWFEHTLYLSNVLSKNLIEPLGDEFLFAKPLRILEVGSYEGGSATFYIRYLMSHPNSTITCVDPWSSELRNNANSSLVWDTFNHNIAVTGLSPDRIRIVRNDSILALASLLVQGEQFDHIYIDGSHDLNDVVADITLAWRMLAPGGVMTLDDVPWKTSDAAYYTTQNYSFPPPPGGDIYPHCLQIGQRSQYKLEDAISAVVSHLPGADVVYCGYYIALKKSA